MLSLVWIVVLLAELLVKGFRDQSAWQRISIAVQNANAQCDLQAADWCNLSTVSRAVASANGLGTLTKIEDFPSLAQVEFNSKEVWTQLCVGSIITNRHILSTASCFETNSYDVRNSRVRVGTSYRGYQGEVLDIEYVVPHYDYGLLGVDSDIAVVRLEDYVTLGDNVAQAPILGQGIELPYGLLVRNAGWGTTAEGGEIASDDLFSLQLTVHNSDVCLEQYISEKILTENMFCVGLGYLKGRDFDSTDVGAPLFYDNTLVGLLAYGKDEDDEFAIISTSVGSFTEWIIRASI